MAALTLALGLIVYAIGDDGAPTMPMPAQVEVPPEEVAAEAPPTEPAYGVWDRLATCESTQRWSANTGNGYYGGLQEDLVFWRRYGGLEFAARPDLAPRWAQIAVAERGLAVQGWGAWPYCSRRLGLR
jgi:hypothetical protein